MSDVVPGTGGRAGPAARGLSFGVLAVLSVVGVVLWIWAVLPAPEGLLPTGAYGYWIVGGNRRPRGEERLKELVGERLRVLEVGQSLPLEGPRREE